MPQVMEANTSVAGPFAQCRRFFSVWWKASRKAVIEYRPPRGLGKNGFSHGSTAGETLGYQRPAITSGAEPGPAQSEPFLTCRTWCTGYAAGLRRG